jgi:hypothetical protein
MKLTLSDRAAKMVHEAIIQQLGILTTHFINLRGQDPHMDLSDLKDQLVTLQAAADDIKRELEWNKRKAQYDALQSADEPELRAMWGDR